MKVYIAGKIAGDRRYRVKFQEAAKAMEEATRLTQAYIAALLLGRMPQPKPPEDE